MSYPTRRHILSTTALALAWMPVSAYASLITGGLPFLPDRNSAPTPVKPGPWQFFTADEATAIEALVDRLIPPDPETAGGKDLGCAVFIDRQLAGAYGHFDGLYMSAPFHSGTPEQGPQSPVTPAQHYRKALAELDHYCHDTYGTGFAALPDDRKDTVIGGLETGSVTLGGSDTTFFKLLLNDTQQGFFADPIYGGNKDMAAWKMIGFPGARYDYRDWVDRHNERYPLPPVGIADHPDWKG